MAEKRRVLRVEGLERQEQQGSRRTERWPRPGLALMPLEIEQTGKRKQRSKGEIYFTVVLPLFSNVRCFGSSSDGSN